ncbi:unnamed protein product [Bubo scandiacus]
MQRAALRALCGAARAPRPGSSALPHPVLAADKESLLQLRRRTGLPFLRCQEALLRCGGDMGQAEAWLQEQGAAAGLEQSHPSGGPPDAGGAGGAPAGGAGSRHGGGELRDGFVWPERPNSSGWWRRRRWAPWPTAGLPPPPPPPAPREVGENLTLRRAAWLEGAGGGRLTSLLTPTGGCRRQWPRGHRWPWGHTGRWWPVRCRSLGPRWPPWRRWDEGGPARGGDGPHGRGDPPGPTPGWGARRRRRRTQLLAQSFLLEPGLTVGQFLGARGGHWPCGIFSAFTAVRGPPPSAR